MELTKKGISKDYHLDKYSLAAVFSVLWAVSGIYGFIYEMIFYYINGGMKDVYWRGSCFGPWISIYGFGAFVVYFLSYRLKKHPALVAVAGGLGCGLFELASGAALFYLCDGHRGWNYNSEKWNFGNIGGFICLRSVLVFALSSLLLVYAIIPLIMLIRKKLSKRSFMIIAFTVGGAFLLDVIYNFFITKVFPFLISANAFYQGLGLHIINHY